MKFWKSKQERALSKIERRVIGLPAADLAMWAEQTLSSTGRAFGVWQRRGEDADLAEARLGAEALAAILSELNRRAVAGKVPPGI